MRGLPILSTCPRLMRVHVGGKFFSQPLWIQGKLHTHHPFNVCFTHIIDCQIVMWIFNCDCQNGVGGILNGREEEDCLAQSRKDAKEAVRLLQRFRRCSGLGKEVVGLQIRTTTVTEMAEHSILDNEANGHRRTDKRRAPETWVPMLMCGQGCSVVCVLYSL